MAANDNYNENQHEDQYEDDEYAEYDDYEVQSYSDFAEIYDELMDEIPYEEWKDRIIGTLKAEGIEDGLILDLGCGTGTLTELLATAGYDMTGVDLSGEMLSVAMRKRQESGHDILYLCQDMREFELYGTVRAIVCVCDSINYITDEDDLLTVFKLVNNYLDPKGLFIFDFNTVHKYRDVIGDSVIAENREDCSFIWENFYDEEDQINEYDMTFFVKEEGDGLFRKFEEVHIQRGYELQKIRTLIEKAGLVFEYAIDADTKCEVNEQTQRVYMVAREKGK